jgi:hypothetical protein
MPSSLQWQVSDSYKRGVCNKLPAILQQMPFFTGRRLHKLVACPILPGRLNQKIPRAI